MANTYTQIHIQAIFVVRYREALIHPEWKHELFQYISGIVRNQGHKPLSINGVEDHIHLLFGMRPMQSLSDLLQDVKGDSSKWINQKKLATRKFSWQAGFGAFSYSLSQVPRVCRYIENQEVHHRKKNFHDEYVDFLEKFNVSYDTRLIFKSPE